MPEERYLKEIATELRLIRKELQRMNMDPIQKIVLNLGQTDVTKENAEKWARDALTGLDQKGVRQ